MAIRMYKSIVIILIYISWKGKLRNASFEHTLNWWTILCESSSAPIHVQWTNKTNNTT